VEFLTDINVLLKKNKSITRRANTILFATMDELKNESDASSGEDTDFLMRRCGNCDERTIGKSMTDCNECELPICQSCYDHSKYIGCEKWDDFKVCKSCFETAYHSVERYCSRSKCSCRNIPPAAKEALKLKQEESAKVFSDFKSTFPIAEWKKSHPAINYPSKHKGKYLIDLFFSSDSFENGYLEWLVTKAVERPKNQSEDDYQNFQRYRREAAEILDKFKSQKRSKRDSSPKRK
jgi:hypothetical protein